MINDDQSFQELEATPLIDFFFLTKLKDAPFLEVLCTKRKQIFW